MNQPADVQTLGDLWLAAKAREVAARDERVEIEGQILAVLGHKPEGSQTHKLARMSIVTEGRMSYSTPDIARLAEVAPELIKPSLHDTAVRKMRENDPAKYTHLARIDLLGIKPQKAGVSIKLRGDE